MGFAFRTTAEDVELVLRSNGLRVSSSEGKPFEILAEELLIDVINTDDVEIAALRSGTQMDEQVDGAHAEIFRQLTTAGVLS